MLERKEKNTEKKEREES
jgi:hypothetical protein